MSIEIVHIDEGGDNEKGHYRFMSMNATKNKYYLNEIIQHEIKKEWWDEQLNLINERKICNKCCEEYSISTNNSLFECFYHPGCFIFNEYDCCGGDRTTRGCRRCDHSDNDNNQILSISILFFLMGKLKWPPLKSVLKIVYKRDQNGSIILHESNLIYKITK